MTDLSIENKLDSCRKRLELIIQLRTVYMIAVSGIERSKGIHLNWESPNTHKYISSIGLEELVDRVSTLHNLNNRFEEISFQLKTSTEGDLVLYENMISDIPSITLNPYVHIADLTLAPIHSDFKNDIAVYVYHVYKALCLGASLYTEIKKDMARINQIVAELSSIEIVESISPEVAVITRCVRAITSGEDVYLDDNLYKYIKTLWRGVIKGGKLPEKTANMEINIYPPINTGFILTGDLDMYGTYSTILTLLLEYHYIRESRRRPVKD